MTKMMILCAALSFAMMTSCAKKADSAAINTTELQNSTAEIPEGENSRPNHKSVVHDLDKKMNGTDAFESIKKKFADKVVLVDFWATWCPPCVAAMKDIAAVKPELAKKGVVFVYITGETSPEDKWNEMASTIDGEHFRLTDKQWAELGKSLNMSGIPAYLLLNKDGSIAFSNVTEGGYPGNDVIKNHIEIALSK